MFAKFGRCQNRFGIPFWRVGEFTTPCWNLSFSGDWDVGGTIWNLTRHFVLCDLCQLFAHLPGKGSSPFKTKQQFRGSGVLQPVPEVRSRFRLAKPGHPLKTKRTIGGFRRLLKGSENGLSDRATKDIKKNAFWRKFFIHGGHLFWEMPMF